MGDNGECGNKTFCFNKIIEKLSPMEVPEFMRKLGLPENEYLRLRELNESDGEKMYQTLEKALQYYGSFDKLFYTFLDNVLNEVKHDSHSEEADAFLHRYSKILYENRRVACLLYSIVREHYDREVWIRVYLRGKFQLNGADINRYKHCALDTLEFQYRTLLKGMDRKGIEGTAENIRSKLQSLGIRVPESNHQMSVEDSNDVSNDEQRNEEPDGNQPPVAVVAPMPVAVDQNDVISEDGNSDMDLR